MTSIKACLVTIGHEILIGQIVDTNSAWIGEKLTSMGILPDQMVSIGDDKNQIIRTLKALSHDFNLIIMTGGLGPTKDDITVQSIAEFLEVPLEFQPEVYDRIVRIFEKLNRPVFDSHREQCFLPQGVETLHNSLGTAPGMVFRKDKLTLVSLPGVPFEMKAIFEEELIPKILRPMVRGNILQETFVIAGLGETEIENMLQPLIDVMPRNFSIAYLPGLGQVRVRMTSIQTKSDVQQDKDFNHFKQQITTLLHHHVVGIGETDLETVIGQLCLKLELKIGIAESCTGGRVAARMASVAGASAYFMGGIVAYTNKIKKNILHVPAKILETYGAVSEETVMAMVRGGQKTLGVDIAVAISGIAGPTGGSPDKPVGTIWIAVGNSKKIETKRLQLGKKREQNIVLASQAALNMLRLYVLRNYDRQPD